MRTLTKTLILLAALAALAFGQASFSGTTLGAAITTTSQTAIVVASTATMLNPGPANQINTLLYIDRELMAVTSVVDATHLVVRRGVGVGIGGRPTTHINGATVVFSITSGNTPAGNYFSNGSVASEVAGGCTSTSEFVLPKIYVFSGNVYNCLSAGQWMLVSNGVSGAPYGYSIQGFCTGTVGSAETEYLVNAACSGATTSTTRRIITQPGQAAGLYVYSSAAETAAAGNVVTVQKNGSDTTMTCTILQSTSSCHDTTHSFIVAAGDVITFKNVSATSGASANIAAAFMVY